MRQIADAGFLIAYWIKEDHHHHWARELKPQLPVWTCGPALAEAAYLMRSAEPLLQMILDGELVADFDIGLHARCVLSWLKKFADLKPDFADACIVAMADFELHSEIITVDRRDFSVYRTLAGRPLNCSFPPVRE